MFLFSKVFWLIFSPTSVLVWLSAFGLILLVLGRTQMGVGVLATLSILTLVIALTPIGPLALRGLEGHHTRPNPMPENVAGIILLGGAEQTTVSQERDAPSLTRAGERYLAFAELSALYPEAPLYFSGGVGWIDQSVPPEADVMRDVAVRLGMDITRIRSDASARNTRENAAAIRGLIDAEQTAPQSADPDQVYLLITSAFHMSRAVLYFEREGIQVVAYPCDWRSHLALEWFPGLGRGLDQLSTGLRERIGLVAAQLF